MLIWMIAKICKDAWHTPDEIISQQWRLLKSPFLIPGFAWHPNSSIFWKYAAHFQVDDSDWDMDSLATLLRCLEAFSIFPKMLSAGSRSAFKRGLVIPQEGREAPGRQPNPQRLQHLTYLDSRHLGSQIIETPRFAPVAEYWVLIFFWFASDSRNRNRSYKSSRKHMNPKPTINQWCPSPGADPWAIPPSAIEDLPSNHHKLTIFLPDVFGRNHFSLRKVFVLSPRMENGMWKNGRCRSFPPRFSNCWFYQLGRVGQREGKRLLARMDLQRDNGSKGRRGCFLTTMRILSYDFGEVLDMYLRRRRREEGGYRSGVLVEEFVSRSLSWRITLPLPKREFSHSQGTKKKS